MVKFTFFQQLDHAAHNLLNAEIRICASRLKEVHFLGASKGRIDRVNTASEVLSTADRKSVTRP